MVLLAQPNLPFLLLVHVFFAGASKTKYLWVVLQHGKVKVN
jgi:uncharacterized membrane protein YbaN (DUF454 family)